MKKLLLFVAMLLPMMASAYDFEDNGLYFNLKSDGNLEVSGLASWTNRADIPSSITVAGVKYRVTSIGAYAFEGRSDMTYLSIPYSIKSIGEFAFSSCGSSITVNIADPESWCQMQLGNEHASPLSSAGKMLVHDIETTSFSVPETVTSIGAFTFYQCSCLTSLYIPGSVTSIGSSAFEDCDYLNSLSLSEGLQSIGGSAFEGCKRLTSITIPSTVNKILINAFKNCVNLTDVYCKAVNVPNTDASAFNGVFFENVTLHVPASAVNSYRSAWPWNNFKEIVSLDGGTPDPVPVPVPVSDLTENGIYYTLKSDGTLEVTGLASWATTADIPSSLNISGTKYSVTSIAARAFEGRSDITYLSIPYSIKSIGEFAFSSCGSNITVNIADPESWCQMKLGNEHASPLSSAGKMLVYDIETTSFEVPSTVTSIGAFTFYQCSYLKSLYIPSSVTSIGSSAFEDCDYLASLTLNEGLQSIGGSAFEGCKRLTSITIPSTVNSILINAFKNCVSVTDVYCKAVNVPNTDASAFNGVFFENVTLHVPASAVGTYGSKWPWNNFKEIVPIDTDAIMGVKLSDDRHAEYYDLTGRKVHQPQKGLYIKNGKKAIVK